MPFFKGVKSDWVRKAVREAGHKLGRLLSKGMRADWVCRRGNKPGLGPNKSNRCKTG